MPDRIEEIDLDNRSFANLDQEEKSLLEKAIRLAAREELKGHGFQVSVSLADEEEMQALNLEWRGVDSPTDVLSFPMGDEDERGVALLGDIVLCPKRAREQAEEYGHSFSRELAYLSVHSLLHLVGFDHEDEEGKTKMRREEERLMELLQLSRRQ
ncbi:MAG: rRNA maturation RNase YbeY [Eubacteriaceae bacterium]|nr:rRNA maturation RNase YbeY [Eubacteriaceae bacterium]